MMGRDRMNQQPSWFTPQQPLNTPKMHQPRTLGRIILKMIFFFAGALVGEFCLLGGFFQFTGVNSAVDCFVFAVSIVALVTSIFIFFNRGFYLHCLPKLQYFYWAFGATIAFFVLFGLDFGLSYPNTGPIVAAITAGIFTLYGLSFMGIAYMRPPLVQQINASVYHIVKRMPGEQIIVFELLARLQKQYKQEATMLYQSLGNLEYIELINIPGAPGLIYRIKQQGRAVAAASAIPPRVNSLPPQVRSMPFPSQISAKHVQTPFPGRTDPAPNLKLAETNRPLADLETVPVLPAIAQPKQTPLSLPIQPAAPFNAKPVNLLSPPAVQYMLPSNQQQINAGIQHVIPPNPQSAGAPSPLNELARPILSLSQSSKQPPSLAREEKAIQIFCCYAHKDEQLLDKLKNHLKPQQRQGLIHIWHDRDINAGANWEQEIEEQLNTAQIILLLVSADFIASDYCYTKEMQRVLERHARGEVRAIPIILRPTDWKITPLGKLQALPKDGKPITNWSNRENAYLDVATGIRTIVETFFRPPDKRPPAPPPQKLAKPLNYVQRPEAEVEFVRARCTQGKLIVTNKKIAIELTSFSKVIKSQTLLRSSLTGIDSKLAVPSVFGMGGGMNLTFYGKGREKLKAELVPLKEAQAILGMLG